MSDIYLEKAKALRKEIHKYPDLSNNELLTKERLEKFLRENTNLKIVDKGLWFYAKYCAENKTNKAIAFRADMDAIIFHEENDLPYCSTNPNAAHKCGHDGHSATLAYFAMLISEKKLNRDVYLIFQHAEETGDGAKECAKIIKEESIAEIYGIHNMPGVLFGNVGVIPGTINFASAGIEMNFIGLNAHASEPEKGINPAFAISKIILEIEKIIRNKYFEKPVYCTVVNVNVGEKAFGVSPGNGTLMVTARGETKNDFELLKSKIIEVAQEEANKSNLKFDYEYSDVFPATINNKESVDKVLAVSEKLSLQHSVEGLPLRTSEDFGYYLEETKGALMWIGAGKEWAPLHSKNFDFNENLIEIGAKIFLELI